MGLMPEMPAPGTGRPPYRQLTTGIASVRNCLQIPSNGAHDREDFEAYSAVLAALTAI
jgi:hypothetical protein